MLLLMGNGECSSAVLPDTHIVSCIDKKGRSGNLAPSLQPPDVFSLVVVLAPLGGVLLICYLCIIFVYTKKYPDYSHLPPKASTK